MSKKTRMHSLATAASSAVALIMLASSCASDSVATEEHETAEAVTLEQANAALPNAEVLGHGWVVRNDFDETAAGPVASPASCQLLVDALFSRRVLSPEVSTTRAYDHDNVTLATITVAGWKSEETAAELLEQIQALSRTCVAFQVVEEADMTTLSSEPNDPPDLGDHAVAVRMTSSDDVDAAFYISSVQSGPNTVTAVSMSWGTDDDVTGRVLEPALQELSSEVSTAR